MYFKPLLASEAEGFREWARNNYKPFSDISGIWHPVVQLECVAMNMERAEYPLDLKQSIVMKIL